MDSEPNIRNKLSRGKFTAVFLTMLRGYRSIVAALGLILVGAQAPNPKAQAEQPKTTVQAAKPAPFAPPAPPSVKEGERPEIQRPCGQDGDNRNSDLCAQWKAADAATESARWTFWTVVASLIGLAVGGGTLFAAWRAAHWAKRAADHTETGANAATSANLQNKLSAERHDRAYIAVQPAGIHKFSRKDGLHQAIGHIVIKNVGAMIAKNVASFVEMEIVEINTTKHFPVDSDPRQIERAIQVGDEMRQAARNEPLPEIREVDRHDVHAYVWGVVYYDDGFGQRRFTRFCHRYPGARVQRDTLPNVTDASRGIARYIASQYSEELIPAKYARHYEDGNDAD